MALGGVPYTAYKTASEMLLPACVKNSALRYKSSIGGGGVLGMFSVPYLDPYGQGLGRK